MCGIVGFVRQRDFDIFRDELPAAVASLSHRGPDDAGLFFDETGGLGLGHRRLSVIDLSRGGRQPMQSADEQVSLVYNGEVYNFREIRRELEGRGHRFRSRSDTEVILNAWLEWGMDCLHKFVGMFALALWDNRERRLYLVRDRMGIKPLYYNLCPKGLLFASELKALMAFTRFPRTVDEDALGLFLHYQYIPAPRTIFQNTFKLLPGHFLVCDGKSARVHSYWTPPSPRDTDVSTGPDSETEYLTQLDEHLTTAVADRLISDVPLGALLSGGIDSSLVAALMQKQSTSPVRTFSIGFRETGYDEAPWAAKVAEHLGTDHTELYVTPRDATNLIPRLPEIYDEPFADSSAIPTALVSRLVRSQVTVALSGDGGDEQFAGYVRYWMTCALVSGFDKIPGPWRSFLAGLFGRISPGWLESCYLPWRDKLPQRFRVSNFQDKWQKLIRLMGQQHIRELYRATVCIWPREEAERLWGGCVPGSQYEKCFAETEGWPSISRLMHTDRHTYLPDAMLTKVDRASMSVGLEVRVPLLDHRVVAYTTALPDDLKYRNGEGKYLLRKLLARYVPEALFERPKMGFGVPIAQWFRGDLKELLLDYVSPACMRREGRFDPIQVDKKITEHLSETHNHQHQLWALLMWEMWRERWLGR